ncbi:hypothetical protein K488DRAFT_74346 [Vararia minispora EC-137]|uniref:Uncharacterized protein n=1 Tax=Vararia minispora EC-137 TaxID=1314806 RepID=A0ACB8Q7B1_9AGAM|nr:hypothetical protein K488DRAFT_74346 [Vararia minispora EC-137]
MAVAASPPMYDSSDLLVASRHLRTPATTLPALPPTHARHHSLPYSTSFQPFSYDPIYDPKPESTSYSYPRPSFAQTPIDYDEPPSHQLDRAMAHQWSDALFKVEAGASWESAHFDTNNIDYDAALSLSPASNRSFTSSSSGGASATGQQVSPSLSPLDLRQTRDLPRLSRPVASPESIHHGLPSLIGSDFDGPDPYAAAATTTTPTVVPPQQVPKTDKAKVHDPDAASFLQERLGPAKWATFSARLFDKRLSSSRTRRAEDDDGSSLSVYSFLVKVEAVKEVLRTLVPHPYNPEKTADHPFPRCAKGYVRLTRETVLALAGWSNTQFSYWMRRVEAIAVFSSHDATLRQMKHVLLRLLYPEPGTGASPPPSPLEMPNITGKGLDALIDDIKRRTGASQFLRGKHASLDAFCAAEHAPAAAAAASPTFPTFHAQMYSHEQRVADQARRKRKRAESDAHAASSFLRIGSPHDIASEDAQPVGRIGGAFRPAQIPSLLDGPAPASVGPPPLAPYAFPLSHARGADGVHTHKRVRTIG